MTIPQFLEKLRAVEARWQVYGSDIRCEAGNCPLTAVAQAELRETYEPDFWPDAAAALDLDYEDAQAIVEAADYDRSTDLRRQLLAATVNRA